MYVAEVPELAGCMAHGKNQQEALTNVRQAALGERCLRGIGVTSPQTIPLKKSDYAEPLRP